MKLVKQTLINVSLVNAVAIFLSLHVRVESQYDEIPFKEMFD